METTFYIQFEAERYSRAGYVRTVKARRITTKRPDRPIPGSILVKMSVDIDERAFEPYEPEVDIEIPADRAVQVKVHVLEPDPPEEEDAETVES
jgi:hypothetical protein